MERFSYEQSEKKNILSSGGKIRTTFKIKKLGVLPLKYKL